MSVITVEAYHKAIQRCKDIFIAKNRDYGTAWRILRLMTLTDQIMIKAERIRFLESERKQLVQESIHTEFIGIFNYAMIALVQMKLVDDNRMKLPEQELIASYDECVKAIAGLLEKKNHDYNEAWRKMRVSSMVDIILMKLLRIKRIEDLGGQVIVSEGIQANYQDIANYAIFCLIRLQA